MFPSTLQRWCEKCSLFCRPFLELVTPLCRTSFALAALSFCSDLTVPCRTGLLVMNSSSFCVLRKTLCCHFLRDSFAGYRILGLGV